MAALRRAVPIEPYFFRSRSRKAICDQSRCTGGECTMHRQLWGLAALPNPRSREKGRAAPCWRSVPMLSWRWNDIEKNRKHHYIQ